MIVTKMALPRRTFLRGVGATLALPLLDSMVPALTAMANTAATPAMRLAFFYVSNGVHMPSFRPKGEGTNFELSQILKPLEPVKDQLVVISGTGNSCADSKDISAGPHARCCGAWLSGVRPKHTMGADIESGKTVDQYAADVIGKDSPVLSLEMGLESSYSGTCDHGYSCAYVNTQSWRTPTSPNPIEQNPRVIFERLFGDGGNIAARQAEWKKDRSILDSVLEDMRRLQKRLGPDDRSIVNGYLDAVRDVETRIQIAEKHAENQPTPPLSQPVGIPDQFDDFVNVMLDLQFLAYQADITRVVSFQTSREQGMRTFPFIGVAEGHHDISHHQNDPARIAKINKICTYFVDMTARLARKMRATPDGDGTLLDHSMLLWGAGMGSGDLHTPHNLPCAIVGGGCGQLKGGRHIIVPFDTPFMNVGLTVLDKVGVHMESIGDSTGRIAEL